MKCKKCRKTIPDGSKFCNHCGAPISAKKKLYRRPDGLYEKIMMIDGKRVAFRAQKEVDVFKKIREYENNRAIKEKHGELFSVVAEMWKSEHWETLPPSPPEPHFWVRLYFFGLNAEKWLKIYINSIFTDVLQQVQTVSNRIN